jgi:hypothetical protein
VKGWGLLASALTLLHGFYLALYFLWVVVLILVGLARLAPPVLNPLALAMLDTVVYLYLGVGMLRGRRSYFVYAVLWTVWGALLATFGASYKNSVLNLLSFLIVFSCTYYHVNVNKTKADIARILGRFSGVLALIQGIIVAFAFTLAYLFHFRAWIILVPPLDQLNQGLAFITVAIVTVVVYLVSGAGMLKGKKEFFFVAISWTIVEATLAIADSSFARTHFNIISMLILAFATYYYQKP